MSRSSRASRTATLEFARSPEGGGERVTEVVFEGDPQITAGMRANHAFAVLPLERGADGGLVVRYRVLLDG
jgi:hypothetical protein